MAVARSTPDVVDRLDADGARLVARAAAMGLAQPRFDRDGVRAARAAFARAGVGRARAGSAALLAAVERSPVPDHEWAAVDTVLGAELLQRLVGVSGTSVRRYAARQRRTPDEVAGRLHVLALVIADLLGSYNEYGIRRWFERPRTALGGRSPTAVLRGRWDPDGEDAAAVRRLAEALTGPLAT